MNLCHNYDFHLEAEWTISATSHEKSAFDETEGAIKQFPVCKSKSSKTIQQLNLTAEAVYQFCSKTKTYILFCSVSFFCFFFERYTSKLLWEKLTLPYQYENSVPNKYSYTEFCRISTDIISYKRESDDNTFASTLLLVRQ